MPDRDSIRKTLIELLEADTGEKYPNLDDNANLREGLGLDSVDVVSVVSQIERQYRIRLTHQDLESLATVADVLNLLEKKLSVAATASIPISNSETPAA
jgi:acyl carrier protein